jgi:hypothetical protein
MHALQATSQPQSRFESPAALAANFRAARKLIAIERF